MKLIATLGATEPKFEHVYKIDSKEYSEKFSFLALKKHFNIDKVVIIGTKATKEVQREYIEGFEFIEIDENNLEDVFVKSTEILQKGDILDLTQSFRLLSFGALLGLEFSKNIGKAARGIYYAQVLHGANPVRESCEFEFVSLRRYEELSDLAREIVSFLESWYVGNVYLQEFENFHKNLLILSQKLLHNNIAVSEELQNVLANIKNNRLLKEHFDRLEKELLYIQRILGYREDRQKYYLAKKYFEKNLLLQALTFLYESVNAYLEFVTDKNFKICKKYKRIITKQDGVYSWRNCLKSSLLSRKGCQRLWFSNVPECEEFRAHLKKIDVLRNDTAHAFINESDTRNFRDDILQEIEFFGKYMK